jgi:hypothetical protein
MSLKLALEFAAKGFHVFPISADKVPQIQEWPECATNDPEMIKKMWTCPVMGWEQPYSVGISSYKFGNDGEKLIIVDVDNKGEKKGDEEIMVMELHGEDLPRTYSQLTPTGGQHFLYRTHLQTARGVNKLAPGVDVPGYCVAAGTVTEKGTYTGNTLPVAKAPLWLENRLGPRDQKSIGVLPATGVDAERARQRAVHYLKFDAPIAVKGQGGDHTTYRVAARLKDFGLSAKDAWEIMLDHWNERCPPGWAPDRLQLKVEHAYKYGTKAPGTYSPEAMFPESEVTQQGEHPFDKMNQEFGFMLGEGGHHIIWETTDQNGRFRLKHLPEPSFHRKFASLRMSIGDGKTESVTKLWMNSPKRRSYDGVCFRPGRDTPGGYYNLWRGFAVQPGSTSSHSAVQQFLDHAKENFCHGDETLFKWLIGYFAHLVQKPWEKPLVAIVLRGGKGVGKNSLVECIGSLLGGHYLVASNPRYLLGNFNGHLENLLLFCLDEAFWSGDKRAEGTLKDLITGRTHVIERKNHEPYTVENCTRIIIIGNEEWIVPASQDERRFAVFDVGDGRKQDRDFFQRMREGMEQGGCGALLRYLLDFDLSQIDINDAPKTEGLLDQKVNSLEPFYQWWLECLTAGEIVGGELSEPWSRNVSKDFFRNACYGYLKKREIRTRRPHDHIIGRMLRKCLPSVVTNQKEKDGDHQINVYRFPELEQARKEWERYMGHGVNWE